MGIVRKSYIFVHYHLEQWAVKSSAAPANGQATYTYNALNKYSLSRQENWNKYYYTGTIYPAFTGTFIEKAIHLEQKDFVVDILLLTE